MPIPMPEPELDRLALAPLPAAAPPRSASPPSLPSDPAGPFCRPPATSQPRTPLQKISLNRANRPPAGSTSQTDSDRFGVLLPSAPASPLTPAPSPTLARPPTTWPDRSGPGPDRSAAAIRLAQSVFLELDDESKRALLKSLLGYCSGPQLSFAHTYIAPRLRRDPFVLLPPELVLQILSMVDDPKTIAQASQVSRHWRDLVADQVIWKTLCEKHEYVRRRPPRPLPRLRASPLLLGLRRAPMLGAIPSALSSSPFNYLTSPSPVLNPPTNTTLALVSPSSGRPNADGTTAPNPTPVLAARPTPVMSAMNTPTMVQPRCYRAHFKHQYSVDAAWRSGGRQRLVHKTSNVIVVTGVHISDRYIIVTRDNSEINVYKLDGTNMRDFRGHTAGVWAMDLFGDILVTGGCDRDVRVWNVVTGASVHVMPGHSSTVRCLTIVDRDTVISGSRDASVRVWDMTTGVCRHILLGHQGSVRCLAVHGDHAASGAYDTVAKLWDVRNGSLIRTFSGHTSHIYAIVYDGKRVITGSLDTSIRIWSAATGSCIRHLQGHTSLVGHLQMLGSTLVSGGSDGSIRIWSLDSFQPVTRIAAHDNSVISLQADGKRIVSGGSDGRVKIWDSRTGRLVRELGEVSASVWRVAFSAERAVVFANRDQHTVMELWSFSPADQVREPDVRPCSYADAIQRPALPRDAAAHRPLARLPNR